MTCIAVRAIRRAVTAFFAKQDDVSQIGGSAIETLETRQLLSSLSIAGTSGNDTIIARVHQTDAGVETRIWVNADPATAPATHALLRSDLVSIDIAPGDGNDTLTIDLSAGTPFRDGVLWFDGGAGNDSLRVDGSPASQMSYVPSATDNGSGRVITDQKVAYFSAVESVHATGFGTLALRTQNATDSVTLDTPSTGTGRAAGSSGSVNFAPLTFSSITKLSLDLAAADEASSADAVTVAASGVAGISRLRLWAGTGNNSLNVLGGTTELVSSVAPDGGGFLVTHVRNSAVLNLPYTQYLAELHVLDTARVNLTKDAYKLLLTDLLDIGPTAKLDLADNDLIVHGGNVTQVTNWIKSGYAGRAWTGYGIISSTAHSTTQPNHQTTLGIASVNTTANATAYSDYADRPVNTTDVLVKYTYAGDANLDADVNADDYLRIDQGFLNGLTGWYDGDFNYSGSVNADDYFLIDNASAEDWGKKPPFTVTHGTTVNEGAQFTLNLSAPLTYMQDGYENYYDPIGSWTVYWGDDTHGTYSGNVATASHAYAEDGTYTVKVVAGGQDISYHVKDIALTVNDVAPTLSVISDPASPAPVEGGLFKITLASADASNDDAVNYWTINWGDGTPEEPYAGDVAGASHFYADSGSYTVTATAHNDDGNHPKTLAVNVANKPPVASATGSNSAAEGGMYLLNLSASDEPSDTLTWTINWGDGSTQTVPGTRKAVTHVFASRKGDAPVVTATASDDDGGSTAAQPITVSVGAPPQDNYYFAAYVNPGSMAQYNQDLSEFRGEIRAKPAAVGRGEVFASSPEQAAEELFESVKYDAGGNLVPGPITMRRWDDTEYQANFPDDFEIDIDYHPQTRSYYGHVLHDAPGGTSADQPADIVWLFNISSVPQAKLTPVEDASEDGRKPGYFEVTRVGSYGAMPVNYTFDTSGIGAAKPGKLATTTPSEACTSPALEGDDADFIKPAPVDAANPDLHQVLLSPDQETALIAINPVNDCYVEAAEETVTVTLEDDLVTAPDDVLRYWLAQEEQKKITIKSLSVQIYEPTQQDADKRAPDVDGLVLQYLDTGSSIYSNQLQRLLVENPLLEPHYIKWQRDLRAMEARNPRAGTLADLMDMWFGYLIDLESMSVRLIEVGDAQGNARHALEVTFNVTAEEQDPPLPPEAYRYFYPQRNTISIEPIGGYPKTLGVQQRTEVVILRPMNRTKEQVQKMREDLGRIDYENLHLHEFFAVADEDSPTGHHVHGADRRRWVHFLIS